MIRLDFRFFTFNAFTESAISGFSCACLSKIAKTTLKELDIPCKDDLNSFKKTPICR